MLNFEKTANKLQKYIIGNAFKRNPERLMFGRVSAGMSEDIMTGLFVTNGYWAYIIADDLCLLDYSSLIAYREFTDINEDGIRGLMSSDKTPLQITGSMRKSGEATACELRATQDSDPIWINPDLLKPAGLGIDDVKFYGSTPISPVYVTVDRTIIGIIMPIKIKEEN